MEGTNDTISVSDQTDADPGQETLSGRMRQRQGYPEHNAPQHPYFETGRPPAHHNISTIPEGAPVDARDKSPHSSATTTGSSTTSASLGNASSVGGDSANSKGPSPDFPKGLTPPAHQQAVVPEDGSWPASYTASPVGQDTSPGGHNPENTSAALKMLVSNNVAGSIIGRAGQTISELQSESNTRIKLSQSGDYYPGTQDRVCLIQGEPKSVKLALRLLMERLYLLQKQQHSPAWPQQQQQQQPGSAPAFDFVVKLLVPLSCCGMIIGKSGSNIKFMEENSGVASIRLSPKDEGALPSTSERIVTVTGTAVECCLQCVYLVFDGMASHPDISHYSNMTTSYACMVSAAYGSSSGAAAPIRQHPVYPPPPTAPSRHSPEQHQPFWGGSSGSSPCSPAGHPSNGLTRRSTSSPDLPGAIQGQRPPAQLLHYSEANIPDRLLSYGSVMHPSAYSPLHMPQGLGVMSGSQQQPLYLMQRHVPGGPPSLDVGLAMDRASELQHLHHQHHHNTHHHSVSHSTSAPNLLAVQLEQSLHLSQPPPPPLHQVQQPPPHEYSNSALVPQTPLMIAPGCFNAQVLIPDSMIGSILGRGGRTLTELQMLSGTRIRISQRGEYMPGTRSRIVTVRGPTAQSVWQAQYMISQRMVLPPTATYTLAWPARSSSSGSYDQSGPLDPGMDSHREAP